MIIYEGPSLIDGTPIVVIATEDENPKTGRMLFTWILCQDRPPEVAAYDGSDAAICGDCKFRAQVVKQRVHAHPDNEPTISHTHFIEPQTRMCYVRLGADADEEMSPSEVWHRYKEKRWPKALGAGWTLSTDGYAQYQGKLPVRIASYGDAAVVPTRVWAELVRYAKHWTGYTHLHKPRKCLACAQEIQKKVMCPDGGLVSIVDHQDAGNGMVEKQGRDMVRCGTEETKSTLIGSRGSGSRESGPKLSDILVTTPAALTPDTSGVELTQTTCEIASRKVGTSQVSLDTMSGEKIGHLRDEEKQLETRGDDLCEKCNGTGYEWMPDPELKRYCMASVDTLEERVEAQALGWRTFMVVPSELPFMAGVVLEKSTDILCPATDPHPKRNTTCSTCRMCMGTGVKMSKSIWEVAHGKNKERHTWNMT